MSTLLQTTYLVRDYDEAIAWFTSVLGFTLLDDSNLGNGKRWVVVGAPDGGRLLLAQPGSPEQAAHVGLAAGGRVSYFLHVAHFHDAVHGLREAGVHFEEEPRHETYGWVVVFRDLYGNRWDLIEAAPTSRDVLLAHFDALSRHDADAFFATLHDDVVWATGSEVFFGLPAVRALFDDGFWTWQPRVDVISLLADGDQAVAEVHEVLHVDGDVLEFDLAVVARVEAGVITTLKAYREGSADL